MTAIQNTISKTTVLEENLVLWQEMWPKLKTSVLNSGISDAKVLEAMSQIPRCLFLPQEIRNLAIKDTAVPIPCNQTISQPSIVGLMTQALEAQAHHHVLEIGCGSGYQAAILSYIFRKVVSIERHRKLYDAALKVFNMMSIKNIVLCHGDGCMGQPDHAPYDRIIVTAACDDLLPKLFEQLKENGIMVFPSGEQDKVQDLVKLRKINGKPQMKVLEKVRFVPIVEGKA